MRKVALFGLMLLTLLVGLGCGGAKGGSSTTGTLRLTVDWPEPSRLIPDASNSIKLTILAGADVVATKVVERPPSGSGKVTVEIGALPPITVLLKATAHPNIDGTGNAQAEGTAQVALTSNTTTSASILMGTTISKVRLTPPISTLQLGSSAEVVASAFDAEDNLILTNPARWSWEVSNGNVAIIPDGATCLLEATHTGTSTITVRETESGKYTSSILSVGSSSIGTYTIHPLPYHLGMGVWDINDKGIVVGSARRTGFVYFNAFKYSFTQGFEWLPMDSFPENYYGSNARRILNDDTILGTYQGNQTSIQTVAVWKANGEHTVPLYPNYWTHGSDMNSSGQIVYRFYDGGGWFDAYYEIGNPSSFQALGYNGTGGPVRINESGIVAYADTYLNQAGTFKAGHGFSILNTPHNSQPSISAINDAGVVLGGYRLDNSSVACIWTSGQREDLPINAGIDINENGIVIGRVDNEGNPNTPCLWTHSTGVVLLEPLISNLSGWTNISVTAINNMNMICGAGEYQGQQLSFVLVPN